MLTSPMPFIPISGTLLLQVVAGIRHQEFLRGVGEGKDHDIFYSHQLLVALVILVSAIIPVKVLNVGTVGSGNAFKTKLSCQDPIRIPI